jgi:beta-glucosidase
VAGKNADNLGHQCGGWTIDWQGGSGPITTGTTILQAVRKAAGSTKVTFAQDGSGARGADVALAVLGETPYAEGEGDREGLELDAADLGVLRDLRAQDVPVVLVLVAGRPLVLGTALELAEAVVVAWLPGSEGEGVSDVLFGSHAPTGRLSHSWPRSMAQVPLNVGDSRYDPLFPYGFGLNYAAQ